MIDYQPLFDLMQDGPLDDWAKRLPVQIKKGLDTKRYGDIPRWQEGLAQLPEITATDIDLNAARVRVGTVDDVDAATQAQLEATLKLLHPWRKGPFELFGVHINTEWRSDWKWDRLKDHIQPLAGRTVLDVGSGNGYHCWRMRGAGIDKGAELVMGIDPAPLFIMQYQAVRQYAGHNNVFVLPMGIDDVPQKLEAFDTVFSMGVLYHRRSPLDHLYALKDCLKSKGELVLETLVIEGNDQDVLLPDDRYARMGNVWFIPSVGHLQKWAVRCGFRDVRIIDVNVTSPEEQRATDWMTFQSLSDFLDPQDSSKSIEGYPAPRRAILLATKP